MKADRFKKRHSKDYRTQALNLGEQSFDNLVKRTRNKRITDSASHKRALTWQSKLHADAARMYGHYFTHGDHRPISKLVLASRGHRTRGALIRWVERVCSLRWDESRQCFRGARSDEDLSPQRASTIEIHWHPTMTLPPSRREVHVIERCKVCGRQAIPGEDICHHDQSE